MSVTSSCRSGCNLINYGGKHLVYNINLPIDENGYYHMELGEAWQSLKRITANLKSEHLNNRDWSQRDLVETIRCIGNHLIIGY